VLPSLSPVRVQAELLELDNTPDYLEGKSFASVIRDPSQPFRSEVRAIIRRGEMTGRMVKNTDWRYVEWDQGRMGNELYDQARDPVEYHNLAGDPEYADIVLKMKDLLYQDH